MWLLIQLGLKSIILLFVFHLFQLLFIPFLFFFFFGLFYLFHIFSVMGLLAITFFFCVLTLGFGVSLAYHSVSSVNIIPLHVSYKSLNSMHSFLPASLCIYAPHSYVINLSVYCYHFFRHIFVFQRDFNNKNKSLLYLYTCLPFLMLFIPKCRIFILPEETVLSVLTLRDWY